MKTQVEKALVLAPHPDDEINIAGQVIPSLITSGIECWICFSTNGDYNPWDAKVRHFEALKAASRLGVPASHVIFLGYGDNLDSPHIYIEGANQVIVSKAGHYSTYVPRGMSFSEAKNGVPSPYTRAAFIGDIASVIESIFPGLVICVDYDSHSDHKALSLAFEHAMASILSANQDYRPIVLKKFAYTAAWRGPEDYWDFLPSEPPQEIADSWPFELPNPTYSWDERLCLKPDARTLTPSLRHNLLFRAAKAHKSQLAWANTIKICNSDVVYWLRRTDNLVFDARLSASSGTWDCIDGFSRFEVSNVNVGFSVEQFKQCGWRPDPNDNKRLLEVAFSKQQKVAEIKVVVSPLCDSFPQWINVMLDDTKPVHLNHIAGTCVYYACFEAIDCVNLAFEAPLERGGTIEAVEIYDSPTNSCLLTSRLFTVLPKVAAKDGCSRESRFVFARKSMLAFHRRISALVERILRRLRKEAYRRLSPIRQIQGGTH